MILLGSMHACMHVMCIPRCIADARAVMAARLQVDKICGPGNQYVTAAKMLLQNSEAMVAIDMPAGARGAGLRGAGPTEEGWGCGGGVIAVA